MEQSEYKVMFDMEQGHWWFVARRFLALDWLKRLTKKGALVLDAGCGTGMNMQHLDGYAKTTGVDNSSTALSYCRLRGCNSLIQADIMNLPFKDGTFDAVVCLGVLYHRMITDDAKALSQMQRVLRKGGVAVITSPAFKFLSSRHDEVMHSIRRYTLEEFQQKISQAGFKILKASYIFMLIFPLVFVMRFIQKAGLLPVAYVSDFRMHSPLVNNAFIAALKLERALIKFMRLPFGTTVMCAAQKQ